EFGFKQKVRFPGRLEKRSDGNVLGQNLVHGVMIPDGALALSRTDVALMGRGPQLSFTRNYSNLGGDTGFHPMGYGWSHGLEKKLTPVCAEGDANMSCVPKWVLERKGEFFRSTDVPDDKEKWASVRVNGTLFAKVDGEWYPERGRHGKLKTLPEGSDDPAEFEFTSKDGTVYMYDYPEREFSETHSAYMSLGDDILTRIGLSPKKLRLVNGPEDEKTGDPGAPAQPTMVKTIEDKNGNTMTFEYTDLEVWEGVELPVLTKVTDAVNRTLELEYEEVNAGWMGNQERLKTVTGPDGIELAFEYNDDGLLSAARRDVKNETYEYEREPDVAGADFNLARTEDSNGNGYKYEYHENKELEEAAPAYVKGVRSVDVIKSVEYPGGCAASFQYVLEGENKRIITDPNGDSTEYVLNLYGNAAKIKMPIGKTISMSWSIDEQGMDDNVMISKTDGNGNTSEYEYDEKGNVVKMRDPKGDTITTAWDLELSVPERRQDRNGNIEHWEYDDNGNPVSHTDGDGKRWSYGVNSFGERESMTDPNGGMTQYKYDARGNPESTTAPEGSKTKFEYDIRGRLMSKTDPNNNETLYGYDNLDYPKTITHPPISAYGLASPSTNKQLFSHDPEGNKLSENDLLGMNLTYSHSPRNQVKSITRSKNGGKSFDYDCNGNMVSETDWNGNSITHEYDALNRRVSTTNRLGDAMSMEYDKADNLTAATDYAGTTTAYMYDVLNRAVSKTVSGADGGTSAYDYNAESDPEKNLASVTDPEGNVTAYRYNGRYLRTGRTDALGGMYTWDYDGNGNVSKVTDEEGNAVTYTYDKQNRLTGEERPEGVSLGYDYDDNGNRIKTIDGRGGVTATQYDEWNRAWKVAD
ncbi:MAG: RHS repeat protein, partial [Desulfobacteraceae bacterium]|nr:RHS repeat protein [Desulfobacteraceae bacterium]